MRDMVRHFRIRAFGYDIGCITFYECGKSEFSKTIPEEIFDTVDVSSEILSEAGFFNDRAEE